MASSCAVLIGATPILQSLKQRAALTDSDILTFADTDVLRALEAITAKKPRLVALERLFAATPRGTALINRVRADPSLTQTELRVLAHDSDYSRVLPRTPATGTGAPARPLDPDPLEAAEQVDAPSSAPAISVVEPETPPPAPEPQPVGGVEAPWYGALDQKGTRRAPRYQMAHKVEILIDGNPASLLDLSTCGAQVISPTILRPNQRVRMALTDDAGVIRFNATIAWAAFEIPPRIGPQYRAGIDFVDADAAAVDAFCVRHRV